MLHAFVAILIVTFYGAGSQPHSEVMLVENAASCASIKSKIEPALAAKPEVSGWSFTCAPVDIKLPAAKT